MKKDFIAGILMSNSLAFIVLLLIQFELMHSTTSLRILVLFGMIFSALLALPIIAHFYKTYTVTKLTKSHRTLVEGTFLIIAVNLTVIIIMLLQLTNHIDKTNDTAETLLIISTVSSIIMLYMSKKGSS